MHDVPVARRPPAVGPALLGVAALAVFVAVQRAARPILTTQDNWWAWDLGRRIVADGLFSADPYTFTRGGEAWHFHQWLSNLAIGGADAVGGLWLVAVLLAVVAGLAYAQLGLLLQRRAPGFVGVGLLGLAVLAAPSHISLRGTMFSLLLTPTLLWLVYRAPTSRRAAWVFVLFVLWGNLHGGALIGAGLLLVFEAGSVIVAGRKDVALRAGAVVAAFAGMCVTPYGPMLLVDNIRLAADARQTGIVEWLPPRLLVPSMLAFTALVVLVILGLALAGGRDRLPDALLVAAATILAMAAVRNVITMAMVLAVAGAPCVAAGLDVLRNRPERTDPPPRPARLDRLIAVTVAVIGVALVLVVPPRRDDVALHADDVPIDLIREQAEAGRGQRLFALDSWAMPAAVLGDPTVKTFYDGRVELLGDLLPVYSAVMRATPEWQATLDEYCVGDLLIPDDTALYAAVSEDHAWEVVGTEESERGTAVWLTRQLPSGC